VPVSIQSIKKITKSDSWDSQQILRVDQNLLIGEPLIREDTMYAMAIGDNADSYQANSILQASDVRAAIERIRQEKFPPAKKSPSKAVDSAKASKEQYLTTDDLQYFPAGTPAKSAQKTASSPGPSTGDVRELVRRFQSAPATEKETIHKQLLQLTTQQFERRHQQRMSDLKALEERLTSLRTELQKRQELKSEIIKKRVDDLLSDENLLKWDEEESKTKPTTRP
jgi:hypothetical protein